MLGGAEASQDKAGQFLKRLPQLLIWPPGRIRGTSRPKTVRSGFVPVPATGTLARSNSHTNPPQTYILSNVTTATKIQLGFQNEARKMLSNLGRARRVRQLLRIRPKIFDFEPDLGLKLGQTRPKISSTVPTDRRTTTPYDSIRNF